MNRSIAKIVVENREARRAAASSARISTQQGTALEIFEASVDRDKDLRLLDKVLASGHKSVIEHQTFTVAFNDVSVLVEQFAIECRLASFTVKSRRYVDFGKAGYVSPNGLNEPQRELYDAQMRARFDDYRRLMALGIPKEDARFVLPYALRSNFYMTLNAREMIALIEAMLMGRGKDFPEIVSLGEQLKAQFDAMYPGMIDKECARYGGCRPMPLPTEIKAPTVHVGGAALIDAPADAAALLEEAMAFSGRFDECNGALAVRDNLRALLKDARPRELELLGYTFRIRDISLACLTHFTRHRMLSALIPPVLAALAEGHYVLPESISAVPEALTIFRNAFVDQAKQTSRALALGMRPEDVSYFAMSGHQLDILLTMNARELMHFMKLRACSRAQWEIRGVATEMIGELTRSCAPLFELYGPSCRFGACPEGRMSCGRPWERI